VTENVSHFQDGTKDNLPLLLLDRTSLRRTLGGVTLDVDEREIGWCLVGSLDLSVTGLGATGNQVS